MNKKQLFVVALFIGVAFAIFGCRSNKSSVVNNFTAGTSIKVKDSGQKGKQSLEADKDFTDLLNGTSAAVGPAAKVVVPTVPPEPEGLQEILKAPEGQPELAPQD